MVDLDHGNGTVSGSVVLSLAVEHCYLIAVIIYSGRAKPNIFTKILRNTTLLFLSYKNRISSSR